MRILQVTPYYEDAWAYGGIPRVAAAVARALARRGHQVTVATTDACEAEARLPGGGRLAPRLARGRDGVELVVFPNVSNRLAYRHQAFLPLGLTAWLEHRAAGFDVAHLHGFHHLLGVAASRALTRAGVPYLVQPNGIAPRFERKLALKWLFDVTLGRQVLPGAARVVAVSEVERRQLAELGVAEERLRVVPNPVELAGADPGLRAQGALRARVPGPARRVLYLGTLLPRKGVDTLIQALPHLPADVALAVVGPDLGAGAELARLTEELQLGARVQFLGLARGPERFALLADADVVAYPAWAEIFGLVPLEALASGTPVVVADDSGCAEVVAGLGGGLLVPPRQPRELAAALTRILEDPEPWREAARRAGQEARRRFDSARVAELLEQVYAEARAAGTP